MIYCSKCGFQNDDAMSFCGKCGTALASQQQASVPGYSPPQFHSASRHKEKKKRKWPYILIGAIVIFVLISLFMGGDDGPGYENAFAPPSEQGGGQFGTGGGGSQFSSAVNQIIEGGAAGSGSGSFGGGSGSGGSFDGGYGGTYTDAYNEILNWTEYDWEMFWTFMYENLDEETYLYITQVNDDILIQLATEVYIPNR